MKTPFLCFFALLAFSSSSTNASIFSRVLKNTENTVNKAVKDTNAEVNRAKEKVISAGGSPAAVKEVEKLGEQLSNAKTEAIEAQDEKDAAHTSLVAVLAALVGGILTLSTTGFFGRNDRVDKF